MKIKELIKILEKTPNKDRDVYILAGDNNYVTNIWTSIDDNNDIQLFEVALH